MEDHCSVPKPAELPTEAASQGITGTEAVPEGRHLNYASFWPSFTAVLQISLADEMSEYNATSSLKHVDYK